MKKIALIVTALLFVGIVFAQEDGTTLDQPELVRKPVEFAWEKMETDTFSVPVPPAYIREADVMYYHTVWRTLDMREKRNHPYYFPTATRGTWKSLAQTIFDAADYKNPDNPNALPIYDDEFCTMKKSLEAVRTALSESRVQYYYNEEGEETGSEQVFDEYGADKILYYRIKELWIFDKQRSVLDVRILTIEPIVEYIKHVNVAEGASLSDEDDAIAGEPGMRSVGFIYWEELRPYLVRQEMYNVKNNAARISYDDALTWKRQFASLVYREQNNYGDREISEYIKNSRDQRIESERINEKIRKFEHELWEF